MIDTHIGNNQASKKIYLGTTELSQIFYKNNIVYSSEFYIIKNGVLQVDLSTISAYQGNAGLSWVALGIQELIQENGYVSIHLATTDPYNTTFTGLWCTQIPNFMKKMSITTLSQTILCSIQSSEIYGIGWTAIGVQGHTGSGTRVLDFSQYTYCPVGEAQFNLTINNHMWITEWKVYQ